MTARVPIVADGRSRLMRPLHSTAKDRERRYQELLLQFESQRKDALQSAGFFRRIALRRKIREEASAIVRREFQIPNADALFFFPGKKG